MATIKLLGVGSTAETISLPQTTTSTLMEFTWPPLTLAVLAPIWMLSLKPTLVKIWSFVLDGVFPFTRTTWLLEAVLRLGKLTNSVIGHFYLLEDIIPPSPDENR
jgi:hypothetical protein